MEALLTDQDLDQFIWNCIENSTNARDFVDYLNHTYGTFAEQEAAYQKMLTYWGEADTPKQFDKAVAGLTEQAESGTHYPDKPNWLKNLCLTTNGVQ
jgi:hypothetical protein